MPLQDQNIPIHFGKGIDTKTDSKLVMAGKLLRLQDAVFTKADQINKRNGYETLPLTILGGGTLLDPKMVKVLNDEIVCAARTSSTPNDVGRRLFAYIPSLECWADRGPYFSTETTFSAISSSDRDQVFQHGALAGPYVVTTWGQKNTSGYVDAYISFQDLTTNKPIAPEFVYSSAASSYLYACNKSACLGADTPAAFAIDTSGHLAVTIYDITASGIASGTVTLVTDVHGYAYSEVVDGVAVNGVVVQYDVATTSTGAAVICSIDSAGSPGGMRLITIDTEGTITHTATVEATGTVLPVHVNVGSNGNIWVYWMDGSSTPTAYYAVYSPTLSVVKAKTTITSFGTPYSQITAIEVSATSQKCLMSYGSSSNETDISSYLVTTTGVGAGGVYLRGVDIAGTPFSYGTYKFLPVTYRTGPQSTIFLAQIGGQSAPIAQALSGRAYVSKTAPSYLTHPILLATGKYGFVLPYASESNTILGVSYQLLATGMSIFDFESDEAYQALTANNTLVMNGGLLQMYDGRISCNLGFLTYPTAAVVTVSDTGGSISAGFYTYYAVLQWTDSQGNLHQSTPSNATTATATTSTTSISLTFRVVAMNDNRPISMSIYRTEANGVIAKLITSNIQITSSQINYVFVDTNSNGSITADTQLYTIGPVPNAPIENTLPPPAMAMTLHNNRVQVINSESKNQIAYTKSLSPGTGVSFSDLFTTQVPATGGVCVALASMDDKLVILEEKQPFVQYGDGPNDTGQGSTLSTPSPVPADTGGTTSRGVKAFPQGVIFKSPKGLYVIDRSLSVKYLGFEVERYNSQDIVSSTMTKDKSQIRFLTSSGLTLVYDYIFNQWATFSNHEGLDADVWQGNYTYLRTDGNIYVETPGSYLDNIDPFGVLIQTSWLALAQVQGFQRVREFELLGEFINGTTAGHQVQVSAAYDFEATFSTPVPYTLGSDGETSVYQYLEFLERQKCDSISLLIEEVPTGDAAEYITFTDMSFTAAVKKGLRKLPASRQVG